jgi:hypothetical protein
MDFPESFETERLLIRSPLPGDGHELHAAVRESIEELTPWMTWPKEHRTVDDSEASARRARVAFLQRSELRLHLYLKGTDALVGSSGLQGIDWEVPSTVRSRQAEMPTSEGASLSVLTSRVAKPGEAWRRVDLSSATVADVGLVGWVGGAGTTTREECEDDGPGTE